MIWIEGTHGLGDSTRRQLPDSVYYDLSTDSGETASVVIFRGFTGFPSDKLSDSQKSDIADAFGSELAENISTDEYETMADKLNDEFDDSNVQGHIS